MKKIYFVFSFFAATLCFHAQNTNIDTNFGTNGVVQTQVSTPRNYNKATSIQPDGKIVISGYAGNASSLKMAVQRLNANGSIDTDFGVNGQQFFPVGNVKSFVMESDLQTDGKIVLGGYTWDNTTGDFVIVRLNSDGSFDNSFGTNGIAVIDNGGTEVLSDVKVLQDGRILASGYVDDNFAMVMVKSDGTLDTAFGNNGWVVTSFNNNWSYTQSISIDKDGKIMLAGFAYLNDSTTKMAIARYQPNGTLDTSFGNDGMLIYGYYGNLDYGVGIHALPDGKFLLAGHSYLTNIPTLQYDIVAVRFNNNGTIDSSYGVNGVAKAQLYDENYVNDMKVQSDGKMVICGSLVLGSTYNAVVFRFDENGNPDATFGNNGSYIIAIGDQSIEGKSIDLRPNGDIVVAGDAYNNDEDLLNTFVMKFSKETMAVSDLSAYKVNVYPTLADDFVNIDLKNFGKTAQVEFYNTSGQLVSTTQIQKEGKVDISNLIPGAYFIKLNNGAQSTSVKIIKK